LPARKKRTVWLSDRALEALWRLSAKLRVKQSKILEKLIFDLERRVDHVAPFLGPEED